jgi:starch synthase
LSRPLRIAQVSSELAPFAKTGGLGDVAGSLPRYLARAGHDVRPFLPLYGNLKPSGQTFVPVSFLQDVPLEMGGRRFTFSVSTAPLPGGGPPVYFVGCAPLFGRAATYSAQGDEHLRFAFLSRAAIESCQRMGFAPDVFHAHDWHAALVPLYLRTLYSWDRLFARTRTLLTIHNVGYQGTFPASALHDVGLGRFEALVHRGMLAQGRFGFLVTGILHAEALSTVSATHALEMQSDSGGMGLGPLLRARRASFVGIVNGIDAEIWSPERDVHIPARYSASDLSGKAACRARLLADMGLAPDPRGPVLGVVSRLTAQKGFDVAFDVLPERIARNDLRLVALGRGEPRYVSFFEGLARRFPSACAYRQDVDEALAHRIEAGADLFLMPSRFEPCGLNQMYSLRYGTPPLVHKTGGLADTVKPFDPRTGQGTGFVFDVFDEAGFAWALDRALSTWADRAAWSRLVANGMAEDWTWERQIGRYVALYETLAG